MCTIVNTSSERCIIMSTVTNYIMLSDSLCLLPLPVVGQEAEETTSHLPTVIKGYMRQIEELKLATFILCPLLNYTNVNHKVHLSIKDIVSTPPPPPSLPPPSLSVSRSRLVLSESLGRHNPSSPYRRPPSMVLQGRQSSLTTLPFNQETSELLQTARSDITRLKRRQDRKVRFYNT